MRCSLISTLPEPEPKANGQSTNAAKNERSDMNYEATFHTDNQELACEEPLSEEEKRRWEKYDSWQDAVYLFENSSLYLFAICAGLAAPFLNLLNENRVLMNWHGGSQQQRLLIHVLTLVGMGKFDPIKKESQLIEYSRRTNRVAPSLGAVFGHQAEKLHDQDLTRAARSDSSRVALITGGRTLSHLATFNASAMDAAVENLDVIDLNLSSLDTLSKKPPAPISELVQLVKMQDWAADWALLNTLRTHTKNFAEIRRCMRGCIDYEHQVWKRHHSADLLSDTGYNKAGPRAIAQLEGAMRFFSCVHGVALNAHSLDVLLIDSSDIFAAVDDMRHAWVHQKRRNLKD